MSKYRASVRSEFEYSSLHLLWHYVNQNPSLSGPKLWGKTGEPTMAIGHIQVGTHEDVVSRTLWLVVVSTSPHWACHVVLYHMNASSQNELHVRLLPVLKPAPASLLSSSFTGFFGSWGEEGVLVMSKNIMFNLRTYSCIFTNKNTFYRQIYEYLIWLIVWLWVSG